MKVIAIKLLKFTSLECASALIATGFQFFINPNTPPSDPSQLDTNQMDLIAKAVTLKSIKLSDPAAKKLLFSAKHSVLYSFDSHSSNWVSTEQSKAEKSYI